MSEVLKIRPAQREDIAAILALLADDDLKKVPLQAVGPEHLKAFAEIASDPGQFLAVAELADEVVATMQISFIPGLARGGMRRALIEGVRVARARRGQGLGHALFAWAKDLCRERGCGLIQLMMDKRREDTGRFYESLGFSRQHDGFRLYL